MAQKMEEAKKKIVELDEDGELAPFVTTKRKTKKSNKKSLERIQRKWKRKKRILTRCNQGRCTRLR